MDADRADTAVPAAPPADAATGRDRIERGTLPDEVVARLRDLIIQDELPPGTRIPEAELCERFGVSRTPLREAIRVLVAEGLITQRPRRGAVVAMPSNDELQGIFFAIAGIESVCATIACERIDDNAVTAIEAAHAAMLEHHAAGRIKDYYVSNQSIHRAIVEAAGNRFLADLHASLSVRISRDRYFIELPPAAWRRALEEHERVLALLRARDGAALGAALQAHMIGSWKDFEAASPPVPATDEA